jgi:FMN phosphatase YigB (HAD superfamily)
VSARQTVPVFRSALDRLGGLEPAPVIVGDSPPRDVSGSLAAGLGAVWVKPIRAAPPAGS